MKFNWLCSFCLIFFQVYITTAAQEEKPTYSPMEQIINGTNAPNRPFYVKVVAHIWDGTTAFCGGSVIGQQTVLSAAHCFENSGAGVLKNPSYLQPNCICQKILDL